MHITHDAVEMLLIARKCPDGEHLSPYFLEVISFHVMRCGIEILWGTRKENMTDWETYIALVLYIFDSATKNNSHQNLLCFITRDPRIWNCLLNVLVHYERDASFCRHEALKLVMELLPYLGGPSSPGLLSHSDFLQTLILLLIHVRSHIVSSAARILTKLLLTKKGPRIQAALLDDGFFGKVLVLILRRYLTRDEAYFKDCSCSPEFSSNSRDVAMNAVLEVQHTFPVITDLTSFSNSFLILFQ